MFRYLLLTFCLSATALGDSTLVSFLKVDKNKCTFDFPSALLLVSLLLYQFIVFITKVYVKLIKSIVWTSSCISIFFPSKEEWLDAEYRTPNLIQLAVQLNLTKCVENMEKVGINRVINHEGEKLRILWICKPAESLIINWLLIACKLTYDVIYDRRYSRNERRTFHLSIKLSIFCPQQIL